MKKVVRLTENDLVRVIKRVINEQEDQKEIEAKLWKDISSGLKNFYSPRIMYKDPQNITYLFWGMKNPYNLFDKHNSFQGGWNLSVSPGELEFYVQVSGPGRKHNDPTKNVSPEGKNMMKKVIQLVHKYGFQPSGSGEQTLIVDYFHPGNIKNAPKIPNLAREIITLLPK